MVQVIPWSSYTWKSHVDSTKNQITQLEANLTSSRNDLVRIEKELVQAETLGIADEPLPDNYGETPFGKELRQAKNLCDSEAFSSTTTWAAGDFTFTTSGGSGT